MQLLQHQNLEHQHHVLRLGARLAFAFLLIHPQEVWTKGFPVDQRIELHQRIAHFGELGGMGLKVEESWLAVGLHYRRLIVRDLWLLSQITAPCCPVDGENSELLEVPL